MSMYKSNLSVNNYLSKCDFINKYNSLNTQNLLKVSNICLTVDFKQGKEVDLNQKVNAFVYLFSTFGTFPFLTINNTKTKSINRETIVFDNLSLNLLFTNYPEINSFLFSLFVENWSSISMEDILFSEEKENSNYNICFTLSNRFLFGLISNWISNLDVLHFKTKIKFKTENLYPANFNLLKNFPLFWISG